MDFNQRNTYGSFRREELISTIEHALQKLTLEELESLYYDMSTKQYIND